MPLRADDGNADRPADQARTRCAEDQHAYVHVPRYPRAKCTRLVGILTAQRRWASALLRVPLAAASERGPRSNTEAERPSHFRGSSCLSLIDCVGWPFWGWQSSAAAGTVMMQMQRTRGTVKDGTLHFQLQSSTHRSEIGLCRFWTDHGRSHTALTATVSCAHTLASLYSYYPLSAQISPDHSSSLRCASHFLHRSARRVHLLYSSFTMAASQPSEFELYKIYETMMAKSRLLTAGALSHHFLCSVPYAAERGPPLRLGSVPRSRRLGVADDRPPRGPLHLEEEADADGRRVLLHSIRSHPPAISRRGPPVLGELN